MKKLYFVLFLLVANSRSRRISWRKTHVAVFFDFRESGRIRLPKFLAANRTQVLSKVFRKYLTDENKCNQQFDEW